MTLPTVSIDICVLSHNLPALLPAFIDSLLMHESAPDWRLIWVDNGSESGAREQMRRDVMVRADDRPGLLKAVVMNDENHGFTAAMNQALQLSTAEYVCIANNDVELLNPCLTIMREQLEVDRMLGAIGPISVGGGWQDWRRTGQAIGTEVDGLLHRCATDQDRALVLEHHCRDLVWTVPGMVAFFLTLIPRRVLDDVGLLDPRFGMGFGEDDQWCERAQARGHRIGLACGALALHHHRATWRATFGHEGARAIQAHGGSELQKWRLEQE